MALQWQELHGTERGMRSAGRFQQGCEGRLPGQQHMAPRSVKRMIPRGCSHFSGAHAAFLIAVACLTTTNKASSGGDHRRLPPHGNYYTV